MATLDDLKNSVQMVFLLLSFIAMAVVVVAVRVLKWTLVVLVILFIVGVIAHAKEAVSDIQPNRNAGWCQVLN